MFHKGGDGKPRGFGFSGFGFQSGAAAPGVRPRAPGPDTMSGMAGRNYGMPSHFGKRRVKSEEEYFDDEEEQHQEDLEYLPAPGSPGAAKDAAEEDSDSDDPLDAFMADIEKVVKKQKKPEKKAPSKTDDKKGVRDDIDQEDDQESFFRYMEENPMAGVLVEDDVIVEYDAEGNAIVPDKRIIDPLPPIDHHDIEYQPFTKNFFHLPDDIRNLSESEIQALKDKLGIKVSGIDPPKPVSSFAHFGFDEPLMKAIRKAGYTQPMPIQAQGVPIALSGRDIIGIAKTGSGKTAAFLWPMLVHIMDQKELQPGDGPIGLILAPTRELSQQISNEAKKFGKVYNINVVCAYGGGNMWEQCKACEEGAEIIVATPGRLIDLVKKKATNLRRVTFLVYDEADRMFDLGFEPQVRSIANHVRPNRQTLLFSATFKRKVERLARDILSDPIRVIQGDVGEANEDVTQLVKVVAPGAAKWSWLLSRLVEFTTNGTVLIFVTRKANSEELANNLRSKDFHIGLLHGDMSQMERNEVIQAFKKQEMPILVATDVAARGLDIPHIRTVVNFDVARDIDTHTHRVGRTGRAGTKGTAYTLITTKEKEFAGHLVRNLEGANQYAPPELVDLALQNPWFKKTRYQHEKAKKLNVGGRGLGFKERPGLGATSGGEAGQAAPGYNRWQKEPSKPSGPQSDRLNTMKQAFSAQFRSSFVNASPDTAWKGSTEIKDYSNPEVDKPDYKSGSVNYANPNLPNNLGGGVGMAETQGDINYGSYTVHTSTKGAGAGGAGGGAPSGASVGGGFGYNNTVAYHYGNPGVPPTASAAAAAAAIAGANMVAMAAPPPPAPVHAPPPVSPPSGRSDGSAESKRRKKSRWDL